LIPNPAAIDAEPNYFYVLDWVPVRITALGFLLVGHFIHGPFILSGFGYLLDPQIELKKFITKTSPTSRRKPT